MKLSVIIPVFNERNTIEALLAKVRAVTLPPGIEKEVVVVNDGSSDGTTRILTEYIHDATVRIIHQALNAGKTAAVRTGIENATGDILLIQDADLEYDPAYYPALIAPILAGTADVVFGSRFKGTIKNMTLVNRWANLVSTWTVNRLFGTALSDLNTCYKVFRRDILRNIKIVSRNFVFDGEITVKVLAQGHKIYEVPITYNARPDAGGKKITWGKALELYWQLFWFWFESQFKCKIPNNK
jgi:glycosyltransferase involved in cell wall biosynthesis